MQTSSKSLAAALGSSVTVYEYDRAVATGDADTQHAIFAMVEPDVRLLGFGKLPRGRTGGVLDRLNRDGGCHAAPAGSW